MSPLIKTTFLALIIVAGLLAFRGPDPRQPPHPRAQQQLPHGPGPDTSGTAVDIDSAQACINRYEKLMKGYGFTRHPGRRVDIRIKKTRMITTGEVFSGKRMLNWLQDNDSLYSASGKTLQVKVQLGVYDDSYLRTYHPNDSALRVKYKDRIAVFLMPVDSATGTSKPVMMFRKKSAESDDMSKGSDPSKGHGASKSSGSSGSSNGGKALDLGGIQP